MTDDAHRPGTLAVRGPDGWHALPELLEDLHRLAAHVEVLERAEAAPAPAALRARRAASVAFARVQLAAVAEDVARRARAAGLVADMTATDEAPR